MSDPLETHDFTDLDLALEFLKRTRWELRALRKVHVYRDKLRVFDVNGDYFEVRGIGYPDPDVAALLRAVNTAFDPKTIHDPAAGSWIVFGSKAVFTARNRAATSGSG